MLKIKYRVDKIEQIEKSKKRRFKQLHPIRKWDFLYKVPEHTYQGSFLMI
jgi:hypothetical protein